MATTSKISWTDSTFNPWIGCTKVSPGCANCYANEMDRKRFSKTLPGCSSAAPVSHWGKGAPRYRTKTWGEPMKWEREWHGFQQVDCNGVVYRGGIKEIAERELRVDDIVGCGPARRRVFCASLADWLDDEVPIEWLADLLMLIHVTPHLDWLLLTKRPENFQPRIKAVILWLSEHESWDAANHGWLSDWRLAAKVPANVWIGTTVENQEYAERRIPQLLVIPARVRFLSVEPMLGPVDIVSVCGDQPQSGLAITDGFGRFDGEGDPLIHWVICGGESGPGRREFRTLWARELADQCLVAGVPFFMKQDAHDKSGQQGNLSEELWSLKQFPAQGGAQ